MGKVKTKLSKRLYMIFMVSFLCGVCLYVSTSYVKYCNLKEAENNLKVKVEEQEQKKVYLNSQLELSSTDAYIEKVARDKLGYLKSNETVYINRSK